MTLNNSLRVIISGGGITGLTLANLLGRLGIRCTVIERGETCVRATFGGGLGLWRPSLQVLELIPEIHDSLLRKGSWMPSSPSYRDEEGRFLAKATNSFADRFPVLCLNREEIMRILDDHARVKEMESYITILNGVSVTNYNVLTQDPKSKGGESEGENDGEGKGERERRGVEVFLSNGSQVEGDILIAADGIHSPIRTQLLKELSHPTVVTPTFLHYTYFRANVNFFDKGEGTKKGRGEGKDRGTKQEKIEEEEEEVSWHGSSFETWGTSREGFPVRFGYVPLKYPEVFWFIAIPTGARTGIMPIDSGGVVPQVDKKTRAWLEDLVAHWKPPRDEKTGKKLIDYSLCVRKSENVIRTDIHKVPDVTKFPWSRPDGRVVLVGDSAHATAPNIAQGAGLCIEDCAVIADLLSKLPPSLLQQGLGPAISQYETTRKPRAATVQLVADSIAKVGQLESSVLLTLRNLFMRSAITLFPTLEQRIFERMVSFSLGGNSKQRNWIPPPLPTTTPSSYPRTSAAPSSDLRSTNQSQSILGRILSPEEWIQLPRHVREFKSSCRGGSGEGTVTVERSNFVLGRIIASIIGLPQQMKEGRFHAFVQTFESTLQEWTRVFGVGENNQKLYKTTHSLEVRLKDYVLTEGIGGLFDSVVRFIYKVDVRPSLSTSSSSSSLQPAPNPSLYFDSIGVSLFGLFLPLPQFLLPKSTWVETPTENGWKFDGEISFPVIGRVMRYYGDFTISKAFQVPLGRKAIVAGGTGMIGSAVTRSLMKHGYEVFVLTRGKTNLLTSPALIQWDGKTGEGWSGLIDKDTVLINLAGENPGAAKWSEATKRSILSSRLLAIEAFKEVIRLTTEEGRGPHAYLQASAAGVVGDSGAEVILDDYIPPQARLSLTNHELSKETLEGGTSFRVNCCRSLEVAANQASVSSPATKVISIRIGHVLASSGGLLPYLKLASFFKVSRLGPGTQYVPWIHLSDVAEGFSWIASNPEKFGGTVNLTAPDSVTNSVFMSTLASVSAKSRSSTWSWRWGIVPVPEFVLKGVIGDSACILLDSERLYPKSLLDSDYQFVYSSLHPALLSLSEG